jgi:hypothetical protein
MEPENVFVQPRESEISMLERASFMEDIAEQFQGEYVRISTIGPLPGEARDCRLSGILVNPLAIVFEMECDTDSETRYTVANPERLLARHDDAGELTSLEIVSLDASVTTVWFEGRRSERDDVAA